MWLARPSMTICPKSKSNAHKWWERTQTMRHCHTEGMIIEWEMCKIMIVEWEMCTNLWLDTNYRWLHTFQFVEFHTSRFSSKTILVSQCAPTNSNRLNSYFYLLQHKMSCVRDLICNPTSLYLTHYPSFLFVVSSLLPELGQNRIYAPYNYHILVISLPKTPYIHRTNMVLANPTLFLVTDLLLSLFLVASELQCLWHRCVHNWWRYMYLCTTHVPQSEQLTCQRCPSSLALCICIPHVSLNQSNLPVNNVLLPLHYVSAYHTCPSIRTAYLSTISFFPCIMYLCTTHVLQSEQLTCQQHPSSLALCVCIPHASLNQSNLPVNSIFLPLHMCLHTTRVPQSEQLTCQQHPSSLALRRFQPAEITQRWETQ